MRKHFTKDLKNVNRKIPNREIQLPKRFFEMEDLVKIGYAFDYTVSNFKQGHYWFVCVMTRREIK